MHWTYQQAQIGLDFDVLTGDAQVLIGVHFVDEHTGDVNRQSRYLDLEAQSSLSAAARDSFEEFCFEAREQLGDWFDRWPVTVHMAWYEGCRALRPNLLPQ